MPWEVLAVLAPFTMAVCRALTASMPSRSRGTAALAWAPVCRWRGCRWCRRRWWCVWGGWRVRSVCGHLGDLGGLCLSEFHVGDDAADGGVGAVERHLHGSGGGKGCEFHVDDLVAIGCGAHAGDPLAGEGVDNVAAGVDRDHGTHLDGPSATAAAPRPAFMQVAGPMSLPTVAPVPAPTLPCSSLVGVWSSASRTAAMPASMSGRTVGLPKARSKIQLEHTIGTCVGPTGRPMPRLSSSRATPLAASSQRPIHPKGRRRGPCRRCSRVAAGRFRAMLEHRRERQRRRWRLGCHDYGATGAGLLVRIVAIAKAIDIADVNGLEQCIHV